MSPQSDRARPSRGPQPPLQTPVRDWRAPPLAALAGDATRVEVASNVFTIDTEHVTVGGVVTTKEIDQLPLNGRNYLELAKLEPGVEISDGKAFDPKDRPRSTAPIAW